VLYVHHIGIFQETIVQVSSELQVANGRIIREIGRITATSGWHGGPGDDAQRASALQRLIEAAKEYDADAIIGLDYEVDGARAVDIGEVPVHRVQVSGIAVKLARAA
jgi:hypothetical protein